MYLRRCYRAKDGKRHAYWALVKSVRTAKGPRQKVVAYLGDLDEAGRLGVQQAAAVARDGSTQQPRMFDRPAAVEPRWVEVDLSAVRVEGSRDFGGPWLALQLIQKLGLKALLDRLMPAGREDVPWSIMSLVLVICRLCDPSSELRIAEHLYEQSALADLLGVCAEKINDDRLYRALGRTAAAQGGVGKASQAAGGAVRPEVRPAAVRRDQHLLRGPVRRATIRPNVATRVTTVGLQAGVHRAWWSAAAACRWDTSCSRGTRRT